MRPTLVPARTRDRGLVTGLKVGSSHFLRECWLGSRYARGWWDLASTCSGDWDSETSSTASTLMPNWLYATKETVGSTDARGWCDLAGTCYSDESATVYCFLLAPCIDGQQLMCCSAALVQWCVAPESEEYLAIRRHGKLLMTAKPLSGQNHHPPPPSGQQSRAG